MNKLMVTALAAALGWIITTTPVSADQMTLGDVKAQNIPKVTKEEITALLPGSTFQQATGGGGNYKGQVYWKHETDGTLNGMRTVALANSVRAGKWWVGDDGAYCVDIHGQTADEAFKWCMTLFKVGDNYFGFGPKANDSTRANSFTLKK